MKMQSRKKATRDALIAKAQKFLDEVTEEESKMLDQIRLLAKPVGLLYFFRIFFTHCATYCTILKVFNVVLFVTILSISKCTKSIVWFDFDRHMTASHIWRPTNRPPTSNNFMGTV